MTSQYIEEPSNFRWMEVEKIRVGDQLDLEGDQYADPTGDNSLLECEFVQVVRVDIEHNYGTVALYIEGFDAVGFPKGHMVKLVEVDQEVP
jgi:hypothetical protein